MVGWTFVAGSGMLGISIGLNTVSSHATCTAVFVVVAAVVTFVFSSIQTLGRISWLAWVGICCIVTSRKSSLHNYSYIKFDPAIVLIVTIGVGVQNRPAAAPKDAVWVPDYKIANNPTFTDAISAISTMQFSYASAPAFFSIVSEMRDPRHYGRALLLSQITITAFYIATATVIYYYCGSYVSSPALGSAGATLKIVSYGFALPGLVVSTLLFIHVSYP